MGRLQVFFTDSLKFHLSLYGHKLPVLCMDISSDGALIASGSADKNIKFWGLDFGDCHRSVFAHADSVGIEPKGISIRVSQRTALIMDGHRCSRCLRGNVWQREGSFCLTRGLFANCTPDACRSWTLPL